jgi:type IV fimbrial biogenesis protein FimT
MLHRGYSLIEMMVVVAIAAVVLSVAIPSFQESMTSSRTRGLAESIQSGLVRARTEAIRRNAPMRFQLVSTLSNNTCTASSITGLWVVTQYTGVTNPVNSRGVPAGQCAANPYVPPDQEEPCPATTPYTGNAATCLVDPFIAYKGATDATPNVDVSATPTMGSPAGFVVTFGPLGQLLANLEGAAPTSNPAYTVVVAPSPGYNGRTWRVQVNSNGNIRLCDPALAASAPNACL